MENLNIIFKNENLEIFWQVGSTPANGEAKGVKMNCTATNHNDGKTYTKYAGWIGVSMALHTGVKTPGYISETACELLAKHNDEIIPAIISFLESKGMEYRANQFREANGKSAGGSIDFKVSHPHGEKQRQVVREIMQSNAPEGTNHL